MSLEERLAAIEAAPEGPQTAAIFDFDGTVIDGYSAAALMKDRFRRRDIGLMEMANLTLVGLKGAAGRSSFEELMRVGVRALKGRRKEDLDAAGRKLARSVTGGWMYEDAFLLIEAHQRRGHTVVIASSALPFQIEPVVRELDVEHVLCTTPSVVDGVLDGGIVDDAILWGAGKADAVEAFADAHDVALIDSFGYANGAEDIEFLSVVGHAVAINPHDDLRAHAERQGWPTETLVARTPLGVVDKVRSLAAYGSMATSFGLGLGLGVLNRDRKVAVDVTLDVGSRLALAFAGVRLNVEGEEHAWSHRPAVFIFNHQSWIDGLVVMRLLRQDMTGVAKAQVASQPGIGQFARLAGIAFVERDGSGDPRKVLDPVVARLQEGVSIVLSPEGTRSMTPRLGPFKKGAFHMAQQAGVPIVPIVLRNAGALQWRGDGYIRSGTLDVRVLEPQPTTDWATEDIPAQVERIRGLFQTTLDEWGPSAPPALEAAP
ncbi:HAD-IB family hydrolase [Patulibacter minatonensis]|uniref:HAD-IB family hydrolase n=1 Tax=Patulibacter minatonensis TaxID=298163 RepID=UPI00047A7DF2|nr:HAD-IB family hydrolase [Patulibacter minatonensis]